MSPIWCHAQTNWNYSTNLFAGLAYPTNIYIGTNGTDTNGDNFHFWACKINNNTALLQTWHSNDVASIGAVNTAATNFMATNLPVAGLTTNLQMVLVGGTTNTMRFTNGLLQGLTTP